MPAPTRETIHIPELTRFRVAAEPAVNALESLLMLARIDQVSGLDDFLVKTGARLPKPVLKRNRLVLLGLHYALTPDRSWSSFPAYVDHLAALDAVALRDKVIDAYINIPCRRNEDDEPVDGLLENPEAFLYFLHSRFDEDAIIEEVEREAYTLITQPEKMQEVIVSHLRMMWEEVLKDEWERVLPLIHESVAAFAQVDLGNMTDDEVMHFVTGHRHEKWADLFESVNSVVFVPSAHMGPYLGAFHSDDTAWIIFGARQPQGVQQGNPALSRAELLVWLSALSDDTRLRILGLIRERGELCAQSIIDILGLTQSTCSRHLRQLTASGYLHERRQEVGKCYSLNADRVADTARAIEGYAG
ncbi:MAG: ArsR family transcriptional regulator [Anaerolineales bacterium]|nr:MAG: ArsR family transcriptional regulator [Anaerolineales bacterium]